MAVEKVVVLNATNKIPVAEMPDDVILSQPPSGKCKVTGLYVDPATGKFVVKYDDTPVP